MSSILLTTGLRQIQLSTIITVIETYIIYAIKVQLNQFKSFYIIDQHIEIGNAEPVQVIKV